MTPDKLVVVPNQPKTPVKCFRIPEDLYQEFKEKASTNDTDMSTVLRDFIGWYLRRPRTKLPRRP